MSRTAQIARITFAAAAATALVLAGVTTPVGAAAADSHGSAAQAAQPETQEEYLDRFRALNGTAAFAQYQELEVIRSQAVLEVQVGNFTDTKRQRMGRVLDLLVTFREAVAARANGSNARSLELGNETDSITDSLLETEGGRQYAVLADLALDRFFERNGQAFLERAEGIERTPDRLTVLERSATAFRRAGAADRFSQITLRIETTRQQYRSDLEEMNESAAVTDAFLASCGGCDAPTEALQRHRLNVFALYSQSLRADIEAQRGETLAARHALSDRTGQFQSETATIDRYRQTLAVTGAGVIVGFAVVVALVGALVTWRLMRWRRDLVDAQAGDVVLVGEILHG
ncbi:hypothetical protein HZS55_04260 [Halosimplex rubrum]|uniref:Uncharacterized protein n=1 Tax=Halosimplex rubrum TaxID=869889 RepID=A0A7D5P3H0_9EURY|nr:hypothetical protein [Halosimplex rubrum]QLH76565.1 hypothetical protein HZS55_04260 [Halosimplex rubrum]